MGISACITANTEGIDELIPDGATRDVQQYIDALESIRLATNITEGLATNDDRDQEDDDDNSDDGEETEDESLVEEDNLEDELDNFDNLDDLRDLDISRLLPDGLQS
jgi:hypothetical protein